MSEERQLIGAICAEPDEDTTRLAYADWLDEQDATERCTSCAGTGKTEQFQLVGSANAVKRESVGLQPCIFCNGRGAFYNSRAARAEFIRVQCEIAVLEKSGSSADPKATIHYDQQRGGLNIKDPPNLQRLCALRTRSDQILRDGGVYNNEARWMSETLLQLHGPMAPPVIKDRPRNTGRVFYWNWRRGFVETVTCLGMDWDRCGRWLLKRHPITAVRLVMQTHTMPVITTSDSGVRLGASGTLRTWDEVRGARGNRPNDNGHGTLELCRSLFALEFPKVNFTWAPLQTIPGNYLTGGVDA